MEQTVLLRQVFVSASRRSKFSAKEKASFLPTLHKFIEVYKNTNSKIKATKTLEGTYFPQKALYSRTYISKCEEILFSTLTALES